MCTNIKSGSGFESFFSFWLGQGLGLRSPSAFLFCSKVVVLSVPGVWGHIFLLSINVNGAFWQLSLEHVDKYASFGMFVYARSGRKHPSCFIKRQLNSPKCAHTAFLMVKSCRDCSAGCHTHTRVLLLPPPPAPPPFCSLSWSMNGGL